MSGDSVYISMEQEDMELEEIRSSSSRSSLPMGGSKDDEECCNDLTENTSLQGSSSASSSQFGGQHPSEPIEFPLRPHTTGNGFAYRRFTNGSTSPDDEDAERDINGNRTASAALMEQQPMIARSYNQAQRAYPNLMTNINRGVYGREESEKLRKMRAKKEAKETRKEKKYVTLSEAGDKNQKYDLDEALEKIGEKTEKKVKKPKTINNVSAMNGAASTTSETKPVKNKKKATTQLSKDLKEESGGGAVSKVKKDKVTKTLSSPTPVTQHEVKVETVEVEENLDVDDFTEVVSRKKKKKSTAVEAKEEVKETRRTNKVNQSYESSRSSSLASSHDNKTSSNHFRGVKSPPPPSNNNINKTLQSKTPANLSSPSEYPPLAPQQEPTSPSFSSSSSTTSPPSSDTVENTTTLNGAWGRPAPAAAPEAADRDKPKAVILEEEQKEPAVQEPVQPQPPDVTFPALGNPQDPDAAARRRLPLPDIASQVPLEGGTASSSSSCSGESTPQQQPVQGKDDGIQFAKTEEDYCSANGRAGVVILDKEGNFSEAAPEISFGFGINQELLLSGEETGGSPCVQDSAIVNCGLPIIAGNNNNIEDSLVVKQPKFSAHVEANYIELICMLSKEWNTVSKELSRGRAVKVQDL